jgi:hypothetical protein
MTFWQVMALIFIQGLFFLVFAWTGFYFGWMSKKGTPPVSMPIISNILDAVTTNKKEKYEEDEANKSFYN